MEYLKKGEKDGKYKHTVCEALSEHCFLGKDGRFIRISKEYPEFWQVLTELAESCPS